MTFLPNIIFGLILVAGIGFFVRNIQRLKRNIKLGVDIPIEGPSKQRWANMARIALGQSKMVRRPISGLLHIIVYLGFIIINIEVLEIVIDGLEESDIISAMKTGISSIINSGNKNINGVSAGNYGGKLGPYLFWLKEIMS